LHLINKTPIHLPCRCISGGGTRHSGGRWVLVDDNSD